MVFSEFPYERVDLQAEGEKIDALIEQFKNVLNRFVEATAVMVVTTCLIPILVILFFGWIMKTLFHIPVSIPVSLPRPRKKMLPGSAERE